MSKTSLLENHNKNYWWGFRQILFVKTVVLPIVARLFFAKLENFYHILWGMII